MRNRAFRLFCAALMALLIPIQGIGAMTTGLCMSLDHHHAAPSDAHDGHDHEGHDHADSDADATTGSHCGPCTACCASATIAGAVAIPIASPASQPAYALSQSVLPSVQLDGLDRPPLAL
jgi:hypothetical protein